MLALPVMLPYELDYQDTSYWCGPSSTRAVLLTRGIRVDELTLAIAENTTYDGTIRNEIVQELSLRLGMDYRDQPIVGSYASDSEVTSMRDRILATLAVGYGTVVNVVGAAQDTANVTHSYTGHYVAVVGGDLNTAAIMDCAIGKLYRMTWKKLADWAGLRGYLYIFNPPEENVRFGKVKGDASCYVGDGVRARIVRDMNSIAALGGTNSIVEYGSLAAMLDVLGELQTPATVVTGGTPQVLKGTVSITLAP